MGDWKPEDFNNWTGIGNFGQDPKVRFSRKENIVVTGSIAVGGGKKADGSEYPVHWIDIFSLGDTAEVMRNCKKGDRIQVTKSQLQQQKWITKDEKKEQRTRMIVKVYDFKKIERKGKEEEEECPF